MMQNELTSPTSRESDDLRDFLEALRILDDESPSQLIQLALFNIKHNERD